MFLNSSIAKKQTVALTGLLLIIFIIFHLAGNLLIYAGPAVFNAYAHRLHSFGFLLFIMRLLLAVVFLVHICLIQALAIQNILARGGIRRYAVEQDVGHRTLGEKIIFWSGVYIFVFVIFHVIDFALADLGGPRSFLYGKNYGIYAVVFNSFKDPLHGIFYVVAVYFLALHLSHGVQSIIQTFGLGPKKAHIFQKWSNTFAAGMFLGYSSIPIYVYWLSH